MTSSSSQALTDSAALHNGGYKFCQSYCNPKGIKTNAPSDFIFDLVKEWVGVFDPREGSGLKKRRFHTLTS